MGTMRDRLKALNPISSFIPLGYGLGYGGGGSLAVKTAVPAPVAARSFGGLYSMFLDPQEITAVQAWLLYKSVSPLAKVIDQIADEVASLVPMVKVNGEVIDGHPVLKFLARPGKNRTRRRLIKELTVQYLVTGTAYLQVLGNASAPPLALEVIKSRNVQPILGADMWPRSYNYAEGTQTAVFEADGARDPRWIEGSMQLSEIVPIYDMDGDSRGVGLSRLNAIKNDVELRYKGVQHNASLLENGARMSGHLAFKENLNEEQRQAIQEMLQDRTTGLNTGKVFVTYGGEADFNQMSQSAKDMDFGNLVKLVEDAIVTRYNVPVTLYRTDAQTSNNYSIAWKMFYNGAVLPTFEIVYSALAHMFTERLGEEIEIVHDALTNAVLAEQASSRSTQLFGAHLISRNEARSIAGYEPVLGGDTIYGPLGEQPVAEDFFTGREGSDGEPDRADVGHADGFNEARRARNPDEVGPSPGEQHQADQDAQAAAIAAKKPAAKKPAAKKALGRIALIHGPGDAHGVPMRVKQYDGPAGLQRKRKAA